MRTYLTAAIALALLAGCSSEQGAPAAKAGLAASGAPALPDGQSAAPAARAATSSFASLPDRGELLAYDPVLKPRQSGAYTAYPVALSEAHALDAMRSGEMVLKAPNGELLRLKYERYEEGTDGNWSWIGRNADGANAVITFGDKAAFGVIPQGANETLRLTMASGRSWLVATDRSKQAGRGGAKLREGGDQLVPPKLSVASGLPSLASMRAESVGTAAAGAASTVVDVLLGFTPGFASQNNGDSGAVTRLNNRIAITNEAYQNSGVTMRVRLVKTLKVSYADNTDNGDALEQLTGYKSGSGGGPITPDPAFNDLRAARDESGADLVSLVRAFRTPENNGCGIAWLLGGDQSGITEGDAPFGYSVVSDGTDIDEDDGFTYLCREETLAHELGHNMGQAHNEEDSDSAGAHAYSYGYREASSTGFYTVMAYPQSDGDQFPIRYFANPAIKYQGRATGVANQSDNVRSMNQTMPIVSTFRATVVPVGERARNDINGDRRSDFLWVNGSTGRFAFWLMSGSTVQSKSASSNVAGYALSATGDFTGDGYEDIVWSSNTQVAMWRGNGAGGFTKSIFTARPAGWGVVGAGDIDGDGKADLLWQNKSTGRFAYWLMNGVTVRSKSTSSNVAGYALSATGDFNGDGYVDLVWSSNTQVAMWRGNGSGGFTKSIFSARPAGWGVVGAGDVDGDGKADLLWHNKSSGRFAYWLMNGATVREKSSSSRVTGYSLSTTGDFNSDGIVDLVWTNGSRIWLWQGAGSTFTAKLVGSQPAGWTLH
ncbi:MAG TPA: FG-GAP-like repeat-containing protein [Luteimonas sp.]|nr:FG-GAP-like repeat-containing protein [Luteimonas sp.]